jgi:hypothetical protein
LETEEVDMAMLARKLRSLRPDQVVEVDVERVEEQGGEPRLTRGSSLGLVLAWAFIFSTSVAIEPPPAHPNAPEPIAAMLLGTALMGAWTLMAIGLLARHPMGAKASFAAGGLFLAGANRLSGHRPP